MRGEGERERNRPRIMEERDRERERPGKRGGNKRRKSSDRHHIERKNEKRLTPTPHAHERTKERGHKARRSPRKGHPRQAARPPCVSSGSPGTAVIRGPSLVLTPRMDIQQRFKFIVRPLHLGTTRLRLEMGRCCFFLFFY